MPSAVPRRLLGWAAAYAVTSGRDTSVARSPAALRECTLPASIQRTREERWMPSCAAATPAGIQPAARSGEPSGASNTARTRARCFGESPESAESKAEMAARVASEGREVWGCVSFIMHGILAQSASKVNQNRRILLCNIILVMRR